MEIDALKVFAENFLDWMMPIREFAALRDLPWQEMWLRGTWIAVKNAALLGIAGWLMGWGWERHGLRKLAVREQDVRDVRIDVGRVRAINTTTRQDTRQDTRLLEGSIVLSHDIFRGFTIFFARIFGGRIAMYERLFDRARREAIVRLKEAARGEGYEHVVNLKIVSTQIKRQGPATVEVLVYGTGVR